MPAKRTAAAFSGAPFPAAEYAARRASLRQKLTNAVLVMEGNTEAERGELRSGFFQEPNFAWLSGWQEPALPCCLPRG